MSIDHVFSAAVALGLGYVVLALFSLTHVRDEAKARLSSRWSVFFFWWPFYGDLYKESANGLRLFGGAVMVLLGVTWVVWYLFQRAGYGPTP